jgi:hypothetical protein
LRKIRSADRIPVAHGPWERREVAVGENGLGQNLPGASAFQQIHQFLAAWMQSGSVMFHQVTRFFEA